MVAEGRILGNLPPARGQLVGRRTELARLAELCMRRPLVTVTGVGGVGKTRLAFAAGSVLRPAFRDGVWVVELSALRDGALLGHIVAEALPLADQSTRPVLDVLGEYLADRRVLLVLDTCEHLVDACAFTVELLLRAAPSLRVLATSRRPLGLLAEETLPLEPLPVGGAEAGQEADAVALLADRAAKLVPGFAVTEANRAELTGLCRRLDGLPLAIELAAARLAEMPVAELSAGLADRFAVLGGAEQGAAAADPPWHGALRSAIGWSHQLCSPAERLLWARLSVFAGTFDAEGARLVCGDAQLPGERVAELLGALVDESIVSWVPTGSGERYRMLDTLRDYGAGWLRRLGEEDELRARHRDYFAALARRGDAAWLGPDQYTWYDRMTAEHDNLRAALEFCLRSPQDHRATKLTGSLWFFWYACGFGKEGQFYLEQVLAADPAPSRDRNKALWTLAQILLAQGDPDQAEARGAECAAAAEEIGDEEAGAVARAVAFVAAALRGDLDRAIALAQAILAEPAPAERLGFARLETLSTLGMVYVAAGRHDEAAAVLEELRATCDAHGELWVRTYSGVFRAQAELAMGRPRTAQDHARAALSVKRRLNDRLGIAISLDLLAQAAAELDSHEQAAGLLGLAQQVWDAVGTAQAGIPAWVAAREDCERRTSHELGDARYAAAFHDGYESDLGPGIVQALGNADNNGRSRK